LEQSLAGVLIHGEDVPLELLLIIYITRNEIN
jgi:hypothetical protein